MNRLAAEILAKVVDDAELEDMFKNAMASISNWRARSCVNTGLSKGCAWNVLAGGFAARDKQVPLCPISRKNMIWEFGDYLPESAKEKVNRIMIQTNEHAVSHQEPIDFFGQNQNKKDICS